MSQSSNAFEPGDFDAEVDCHENFYLWCNGGCLRRVAESNNKNWNIIYLLRDLHIYRTKDIIDNMMLTNDHPRLEQNVINFYRSFMDTKRVNGEGFECMRPLIALCESLRYGNSVTDVISKLHAEYGVNAVFCLCPVIDIDDSNQTICSIFVDRQWGYFLSSQEKRVLGCTYLFETSDESHFYDDTFRNSTQCGGSFVSQEQYTTFIRKTFELLGERGVTRYIDGAMRDKAAEEVMKLKNILAREDQEGDNYKDPGKRKSKVDLGTLQKKSLSEESQLSWGEYLTKGASFRNHTFDWNRYFEMIGMQTDSVGMLNVPNFNFLKCFKQVQNSPYFIDYLIFTCTESFANDLPEDFAKVLSPLPTQEAPRWKRAIRIIEEYFDHTIAKLYVEKFYTPESWNFLLDSIRSITSSLKAEMKKRLNVVAWLAPDTKIDAIEKVDALQEKIGIPDTWDEYLGVNLSPNNLHMENVLIGRCYCFQRQISRMNKPTNKKEWLCSPMIVNAFYHPSLNEIIFPVAFLQKPMYDPHLDKAVQYGTLGAMIGHEISHCLDEMGSRYDRKGNFRQLWTAGDDQAYSVFKGVMIQQMAESDVSFPFNESVSCEENLADLHGLSLAIGAFQATMEKENISLESRIDGFTPWQRFFMAWAKVWREVKSSSGVAQPTVHGPNEFRCNNPLRNMDRFHETFYIPESSGMYLAKEERLRVW